MQMCRVKKCGHAQEYKNKSVVFVVVSSTYSLGISGRIFKCYEVGALILENAIEIFIFL